MSKVLIIDDEEPILKMYGDALTGHEVLTAKDGEAGLELAKNESPDIILLDIILPKANGLDLLQKLKEEQDTASIPIIMLTNLPRESSADKASALGADGYFVKAEFEPEKLAEEINKILRGSAEDDASMAPLK